MFSRADYVQQSFFRGRASSACTLGREGQIPANDAPPKPHLAVWVRLPPHLRTPEMHTFHFPGGDEDLFGGCGPVVWATLCRGGDGVADLPKLWRQDILARFALGLPTTSPTTTGPPVVGCGSTTYVPRSIYLLCFHTSARNLTNFDFLQADYMRADTDKGTSNMHFEAYLLCLSATSCFVGRRAMQCLGS
jgi:hypothetical protein